MNRLDEYIALEINGEPISLQEILKIAKWRGAKFIDEAIDVALVRQAASDRGIQVSDQEFQEAADEFRLARELHDADTTEEWLRANYLSYVDWESLLEHEILVKKLRHVLIGKSIEQHFTENRLLLDAAEISRLVVKDEGVAKELRAQIIEDGEDFHALARQYSIDLTTRPAGGYVGKVRRAAMEALIESAVFGAQAGKTVGPIKTSDGWELIKVESLHPARLDEAMRESIATELFAEWLSDRRLKAAIRKPLLDIEKEETGADEALSAG